MKRRPARQRRPEKPAAHAVDPRSAKIYAVVRSIPRGRVATYGELAALAGIPSGHRVVARAMRGCPESLPWQRVIGKKDARRGQINIDEPDHAALQRALLESEGVEFDTNGFVLLRRSGWWLDATGPIPAQSVPNGAPRRKSQRQATPVKARTKRPSRSKKH